MECDAGSGCSCILMGKEMHKRERERRKEQRDSFICLFGIGEHVPRVYYPYFKINQDLLQQSLLEF